MKTVIDYACPSCRAGPGKRCRDIAGNVKTSCFDRFQLRESRFIEEMALEMKESEFQREVMNLLRIAGWKVYHANRPQRDERGFPDIVAAKGGEVLFVELKTDSGELKPEQLEWRREIGRQHYVWRPRDMDEIKKAIGVWE